MKRKVLLLIAFFMIGFGANAQVSLIGVGATGSWDVDQDLTTVDGNIFTLEGYTMPGGEFKFRLDHAWGTAWGAETAGTGFPTGIGSTAGGGPNIVAVPGTYDITFNLATAEYSFSGAPIPVVKLVGAAVSNPAGISLSTLDAVTYTTSRAALLSGNAQFDIDGSLFGGATFPAGTASDETLFIPVTEGEYNISFNSSTGDYVFTAAPFRSIALVGSGTAQGWPTSDPDPNVMTTTDGINYVLNNITLLDGEVKFRADNSWTENWGDPNGPGGNIASTAGTYNVTFQRIPTPTYTFTNVLSTAGFDKSAFNTYPNPTTNKWNFNAANTTIETIQIVDMLGKTVLNVTPKATTAAVDATALNSGVYFARIATATGTKTVKVIKN